MKIYCQFLVMSTGYVSGSIPPRFEESNKVPIDLLGSDGIFILDARKSIVNMAIDCKERIKQLYKVQNHIIGFRIYRSDRFDSRNCIYTNIRSLQY